MAQYTDVAALNGLFKEVYGDDVINLVPETAKLVKDVPFIESSKEEGNAYHQPVILSNEHGITYAAADAGAFALKNSIALTMKDASVKGSQMVLRTSLSYDAAAKASNSKKAFVKATELVIENMMDSMTKRLEIGNWYGQTSLALVASRTNLSATTSRYTMTTASWADGIWAGMENGTLDVFQSDGTTLLNTTGAVTVTLVNLDSRFIEVSAAAADITAIDTYVNANPNVAQVLFNGARASGGAANEMAGVDKIVTNTGTLFGISAATYTLWKGTSYSAGSADLTMGKVLKGLSQAVARGLNEKVCLYINPKTWAKLNDDQAALRQYDQSYKDGKLMNGASSILYQGNNGEIEVKAHNIIKEGEGFALPLGKCRRLGAQEISFKRPGRNDEFFRDLENNAGYELRLYTDQAFFIETPARALKITAIVNS